VLAQRADEIAQRDELDGVQVSWCVANLNQDSPDEETPDR
jgi:hypothetical protein